MSQLLEQIQKDLAEAGLQAKLQKENEKIGPPHVFVKLGSGQLELALASDAQEAQGEAFDSDVDYLQFFMPLAFQVKNELFGATSELLAHLNATIPLVGFCLVREKRQVAFRHLMVIERDKVAGSIVAEAVDTIDFLVDTFGDVIGNVSNGRQSLAQVLGEM